MDECGNHHSQQTDTRTENETPHVLTHKWVLKMRTHGHRKGNITHCGLLGDGGPRGGITGSGRNGVGIALGEIPNVNDGVMDATNLYGTCIHM